VIKLSDELMVPGPMFPLQVPRSEAKVSFPSNILKTSLSFSVQKELNLRVIDLASGIESISVEFSLCS
jgi:hypothetical protein